MNIEKNFYAPSASGLGATRRAAVLLLVMLFTTATAWAIKTETPVSYTIQRVNTTFSIKLAGSSVTDSWITTTPNWAENDSHELANGMTVKPSETVAWSQISLHTWSSTTFTFTAPSNIAITGVTFKNSNADVSVSSHSEPGPTYTVTLAESTYFNSFVVTYAYISGKCGSNATWTLSKQNGQYTALTIGGSGAMNNYGYTTVDGLWRTNAPWDWQDLKSVTIGNNITSVGDYAFIGCQQLSSLTIGTGVQTIGTNAFDHCDALTQVTLPASVSSIGTSGFRNCVGLTRVNIQRTDGLVTLGSTCFYGCDALQYIVAPTLALALQYKTVSNWSSYAAKMSAELGGYAFYATNEGGTAAYAITCETDLRNLASIINDKSEGFINGKNFRQTASIALGNTEFMPIGYNDYHYFSGTYDGGGYTISGLNTGESHNCHYWGFFGYVKNGTVKNVRLLSPSVSPKLYEAALGVGALIGLTDNATVQNCVIISPSIGLYNYSVNCFVGSIIGKNNSSLLKNLYYYGSNHNIAVGRNDDVYSTNVVRARKVTIGSGISSITPTATDMENGFVYNNDSYYRDGLELTLASNLSATDKTKIVYKANSVVLNGNTYTVNGRDGDVTLTAKLGYNPELTVTDITGTTAHATWTECPGVASYTLQLASDDKFIPGSDDARIFSNDASDPTNVPDGWTYNIHNTSGTYLQLMSGNYVITEAFDAPAYTELLLTFYMRTYGGTQHPSVTVEYSTDDGTTWSNPQTFSAYGNWMVKKTCSFIFRFEASSVRFRIASTSTSSSVGVGINNIVLTRDEDSLEGSIISSTTVSSTSYEFTGLAPFTTYYIRVKGNDGWSVKQFTTVPWSGDGTKSSPYIIESASQLDLLAHSVNGTHGVPLQYGGYKGVYFKLGNDINYHHTSDWNAFASQENNYEAIGNSGNDGNTYFSGHFDGNNKTISGIRIYKGGTGYADMNQGIFGQIEDADIHDLTLADARITGDDDIGGIVGNNSSGTVSGCHVADDVAVCAVNSNSLYHGGIVGDNYHGTIENCTSAATLTIPSDATNCKSYGGIAGVNAGTLRDNLVIGATVPAAADNYYGAIAGGANAVEGIIQRNYYTACNVAGTPNATGVGCKNADVTTNDGAVPALRDGADNTDAISLFAALPATLDLGWGAGKYPMQIAGRTLQTGSWNTFAVPFNAAIPDGWTVKELTNATDDGSTLTLTFSDAASIVAGKPYLVQVASAVENPTFNNVTVSSTPVPTVFGGVISFVPTFGLTALPEGKDKILFLATGNTLKHPSAEGQNLKGFRAYFQLLNTSQARAFILDLGDNVTSIHHAECNMHNYDNGATYNLSGQKVSDDYKGIVIKNGKKITRN